MATSLCIVCLASNVTLTNITNTYLMETFLSMVGSNIHAEFGRTIGTVCNECHQLLRQSLIFNHLDQNLMMMIHDRHQRAQENAQQAHNNSQAASSCQVNNPPASSEQVVQIQDVSSNMNSNTGTTPDTVGEGKVTVEEEQESNEADGVENEAGGAKAD